MDKPDVTWCQNSYGEHSVHTNHGNLNFNESLIGRLTWANKEWSAVLKDGTSLGVFPSMQRARMALEQAFKGKRG